MARFDRKEWHYQTEIHTNKRVDKDKEYFIANVTINKELQIADIFGNLIYESLIGSYESVNKPVDGKFDTILADTKHTFFFK